MFEFKNIVMVFLIKSAINEDKLIFIPSYPKETMTKNSNLCISGKVKFYALY